MAKRIHFSEEEIFRDRLAYLGTLAGGLAHEVRSPLNSIHLNVELLERTGCSSDKEDVFRKRIGRIKDEVQSLQQTLTEFLQFARPPQIERLATSVPDFIYDVIEFVEPEITQHKIRISYCGEEHAYPILIDRRQMGQVLLNLIFNARDSICEKGGSQIIIRSSEEEYHVKIEVEDDGSGIDEDIMPKLFDAFFTTKSKGTGLGLGIAKRIVYEHGGDLSVKSPVSNSRGCIFTIRLPKEKLLKDASEEVKP